MGYVFGPVPSRRLGRSLGVDLVPFKTCSYDCIYCQLGRTIHKTVERRAWVPLDDVMTELKDKLASKPDYITLSGSGEPTLCSRLDEAIGRIRSMTDVPIAVLTNGSLLWREDVRRELLAADLVIPSLDAGDDRLFRYINRPHDTLSFEQMLGGLMAFRQDFKGEYWLEVFLLAGYTSTTREVEKIAGLVRRIRPDRVQLNTAVRPPTESYAERVPFDQLVRLADYFEPHAEVVAEYARPHPDEQMGLAAEEILNMLGRRPCTIEDIVAAGGFHRTEVIKEIDELVRRGAIEPVSARAGFYCRVKQGIETTGASGAAEERTR